MKNNAIKTIVVIGLTLIVASCASQNHSNTQNIDTPTQYNTIQYNAKPSVGINEIDIFGSPGFLKQGNLAVGALFGPMGAAIARSTEDAENTKAFLVKNNIDVIDMFKTEFTREINHSAGFQNAGSGTPRYVMDVTFAQVNFISNGFRNKYYPAMEIVCEVTDTKTSELYTDIYINLSTQDSSYPFIGKQEWLNQPTLVKETFQKMLNQISKKTILALSNLEEYKEDAD